MSPSGTVGATAAGGADGGGKPTTGAEAEGGGGVRARFLLDAGATPDEAAVVEDLDAALESIGSGS